MILLMLGFRSRSNTKFHRSGEKSFGGKKKSHGTNVLDPNKDDQDDEEDEATEEKEDGDH